MRRLHAKCDRSSDAKTFTCAIPDAWVVSADFTDENNSR